MNTIGARTLLMKVISGGQTGVDRGALDAAIELEIPHGGKCPHGRLAEDGRIPDFYQLEETQSRRYSLRTELNVIESDGTLILYYGKLKGGTDYTRRMAAKHRRPFLLYDFTSPPEMDAVIAWMVDNQIETLNCAGPRESSCEGIGSLSRQLCREIFIEATSAVD